MINSVEYVENQQMPSVQEYINSIPSLLAGDATLPKPIGADTKVLLAFLCDPISAVKTSPLWVASLAHFWGVEDEHFLCVAGICGRFQGSGAKDTSSVLLLCNRAAQSMHVVYGL